MGTTVSLRRFRLVIAGAAASLLLLSACIPEGLLTQADPNSGTPSGETHSAIGTGSANSDENETLSNDGANDSSSDAIADEADTNGASDEVLGFQPDPPDSPDSPASSDPSDSSGDSQDADPEPVPVEPSDTSEPANDSDPTDDSGSTEDSEPPTDSANDSNDSTESSEDSDSPPLDSDDSPDEPNPPPSDPEDSAPATPDEPPVYPSPSRAVGLCPVTYDAAGFLDAIDKAADSSDVAMVQVNFAWDFLQGWTDGRTYRGLYDWLVYKDPNTQQNLFQQNGLQSAYWISFSNPAKTSEISSPWGPEATRFTDPVVADAFVAECAWFTAYAQPDYLAIGVEIDAYLVASDTDERTAFLVALQDAYGACKAIRPECVIFTYFQYENIWYNNLWELIQPYAMVGDAFGFSSYPSMPLTGVDTGYTAATLPDDYYNEIAVKLGDDRPIVLAEFGHPFGSSSYFSTGSSVEQSAMAGRLFEVLDGLNVNLVTWTYLYDPDLTGVYEPSTAEYFGSMGLLHQDQPLDLASWAAWQDSP